MKSATDSLGIVILLSLLVGGACFYGIKDGISGIRKKEIKMLGHLFPMRLTGLHAQIAGGLMLAITVCLLAVVIKFLFVFL